MVSTYKPAHLPALLPYLVVCDMQKSLDLYKKALWFEVMDAVTGEDGKLQHAEMRKGDIVIMFCPEGAMGMTGKAPVTNKVEEAISLYCYCEDVDALYKNAIANGMQSSIAPEDMFWGDRMCALVDINGYKWSFATSLNNK